jgi:hypothetical protein
VQTLPPTPPTADGLVAPFWEQEATSTIESKTNVMRHGFIASTSFESQRDGPQAPRIRSIVLALPRADRIVALPSQRCKVSRRVS